MNSRPIRYLKLGLQSLLHHKLRSFLTILGVVFGVGSVVAMLSVGEGASLQAQREIRKLGSENVIVSAVKPEEEAGSRAEDSSTIAYGLLFTDLERIRTYPAVQEVAPAKVYRTEGRLGRRDVRLRMVGTTPEWFDLVPRRLLAGRLLEPDDVRLHREVCVLAEQAGRDLLAARDSLGETITIRGDTYVVVGIVATESSGSGIQMPDRPVDVYVPLNVMRERVGDTVAQQPGSRNRETVELHQIIVRVGATGDPAAARSGFRPFAWLRSKFGGSVRADDGARGGYVAAIDNVQPTADAILTGLRRFHNKEDYEVSVPLALLRQARETQRIFNIVLGSIAGISLLVGGIGIMNIMLASVTERTREIGIRRAVGAKRPQIISQFLVETVTLSLVGGLIGIGIGLLIPAAIEHFADMPTVVTPWSIFLSLGISALIGIVFGLYPAHRAANLDPIEALRHE